MLGAILAGGKSSRMGTNKALLNFQGLPLIDHMQQQLRDLGIKKIFISGQIENYECIHDSISSIGPLAGIYSVATKIGFTTNAYCLFLPIDMPLLNQNILQHLIDNCFDNEATYYDNFPLPLILRITENLVTLLMHEINQKNFSIKNLLKKISSKKLYLAKSEKKQFINVNTPLEWKTLLTYESSDKSV